LSRNRFEISADILRAALEGASKTRIQYTAYLNPRSVKEYLELLVNLGLIEQDGKKFRTTEKGVKFLRLLNEISNYMPMKNMVKEQVMKHP